MINNSTYPNKTNTITSTIHHIWRWKYPRPDLGQEQKYGGDVTDRRIQNLRSNNIGNVKTNSNI
jgi:hypothetical protein